MNTMLQIIVREFAWDHGLSEREVYPVIRVSDRKLLSFYVSQKGFVPFELTA